MSTGVGGRNSKEQKYWKKPDGWIGNGPTARTDEAEYIQYMRGKRWRELPDRFGIEMVGG